MPSFVTLLPCNINVKSIIVLNGKFSIKSWSILSSNFLQSLTSTLIILEFDNFKIWMHWLIILISFSLMIRSIIGVIKIPLKILFKFSQLVSSSQIL